MTTCDIEAMLESEDNDVADTLAALDELGETMLAGHLRRVLDGPRQLEARGKLKEAILEHEGPLLAAVRAAEAARQASGITIPSANPGTYSEVASKSGVELKVRSLQRAGRGVEVVALRNDPVLGEADARVQRATVFVPPNKEDHFGRNEWTLVGGSASRELISTLATAQGPSGVNSRGSTTNMVRKYRAPTNAATVGG